MVKEKDTREKYPKVGEHNGQTLEQEETKGKEKRRAQRMKLSGETGKKNQTKNTKPIRTPQNKKGNWKGDEMRMEVEMEDEENQ